MGKKGKRSAKTGDDKAKQGPGKARRERAVAMKEIRAGVEALIERLESETIDMELYGPLPEQEECPICFLPMPRSMGGHVYMACCGKTLCGGCVHTANLINRKAKKNWALCAFCRSEAVQEEKAIVAKLSKRAEKNDEQAIRNLAEKYLRGNSGQPKDEVMFFRLHLRAVELGSLASIYALATHFHEGEDPRDAAFAMQLATIAAKKGDLESYYLLGLIYQELRETEYAVKSWTFAASSGHNDCMEFLRTVIGDDKREAIEEAYKDATKLEWSEEREGFKTFVDNYTALS